MARAKIATALFLAGVAGVAAVAVTAEQAPQTVKLSGKVVDGESGKGLEGVAMLLYVRAENRMERQTVTSGKDGAFEAAVKPSSDVIVVWQPGEGYLLDMEWLRENGTPYVRLGEVKADKTDLVLKTRLRPAAMLAGSVVDAEGKPVAGALVQMGNGPGTPGRALPADAEGKFVLKSAPADQAYELFVQSADRKHAKLLTVQPGTKEARIALAPTVTLEGKAVADNGKPAVGLTFQVMMTLNGQRFLGGTANTRTDENGAFQVRGLCADATYVAQWYGGSGTNAGYISGTAPISVKAGQPVQLAVKRFLDDWDAPGHIAVSDQTKCKRLTTYCLDAEDNILACDGASNAVLCISPDDKLKAKWELGFAPEAIECRDDGTVVVAGGGKIALLGQDGKKLREAPLPAEAKTATGVGWAGKDVFVAVRVQTGYGIYRMTDELSEPVLLVKGLRGCCGQMDFTAKDGVVYVAANCDFKVIKYDREGKKIADFGKRGTDLDGFEGCCEPKNVCFDTKGNLYTSESGGCCVKKFTPEGKFLAHMGVGTGIRGCVRVTIAVTRDNSKIYMLDTGRNIIRVVKPDVKTCEPG